MKIINKRLSLEEFKKYVSNKDFGVLPPTFLMLHHTWKPTKLSWRGQATIIGLKKYYEGLGWTSGPHLFIAEDGIWLFTDMYDVGIHAGAGNGTLKTGYSIGIEVVGDYDNKKWSGETKKNVVGTIKILMSKLNIKEKDIRFHSEYSSKTCPGKKITKEYVYNLLKEEEDIISNNYQELFKEVSKLLRNNYGDNLDDKDLVDIKENIEKNIKKIENQKTEIKKLTEIIEQKNIELEDLKVALEKNSGAYKLLKDIQRVFLSIINFK